MTSGRAGPGKGEGGLARRDGEARGPRFHRWARAGLNGVAWDMLVGRLTCLLDVPRVRAPALGCMRDRAGCAIERGSSFPVKLVAGARSVYAATKAAMDVLTANLAVEWAQDG